MASKFGTRPFSKSPLPIVVWQIPSMILNAFHFSRLQQKILDKFNEEAQPCG